LRYRVPQGRGPRVCVPRRSCNTSVTCGVRKTVDFLQKCNVRNQKSKSCVTQVRLAGWGQTFRHPSSSRRDLIPPVLSGVDTSDNASPREREITDTEEGIHGHEEENLTLFQTSAQQPGEHDNVSEGAGAQVGNFSPQPLQGSSGRVDPHWTPSGPPLDPLWTKQNVMKQDMSIIKQDNAFYGRQRGATSGRIPMYDVIWMEEDGAMRKQQIVRRQLLRATGLQPRELRRIDPAMTLTTSAPTLVVLQHAVLLHAGPAVRIAIFKDHAVLFNVHDPKVCHFADQLSERLTKRAERRNDQSPWGTLLPLGPPNEGEGGDYSFSGGESGSSPFELEVMEASFLTYINELESMLAEATPRVERILHLRPDQIGTGAALEELRLVKQALVLLDTRAKALENLLLEVLEDPEDIRGMLLQEEYTALEGSAGETSASQWEEEQFRMQVAEEEVQKAADEVENLIEYFLQRAEVLHSEAERLLENMRDFEESLRVSLSARRLEINKLELMLQISSFGVTLGTLVAGIFGMNLRSNIEEHAFAFVWATCGIVAGIVLVSVLLYAYVALRQKIVEGVHKAYKAEIRTDPSPPIPGQDYNNSGYGEDSGDGSRMFDGMHTAYEGYQD